MEEIAYLAAVPKGPNNYHPKRRYNAAVGRRNWVLGRMEIEGYITEGERDLAAINKLVTVNTGKARVFQANYFAEDVRRELKKTYGDTELYEGGLAVRTSLSPRLQSIAENELKNGLIVYDRRHGWRGPLKNIDLYSSNKLDDSKFEVILKDLNLNQNQIVLTVDNDDYFENNDLLSQINLKTIKSFKNSNLKENQPKYYYYQKN